MIHNHFDKTKRMGRAVWMLCLLTLMPFITACFNVEDDCPEVAKVPITFYLQTAGAQQTRAYIGDVEGTNAEDAINSVKVWFVQGNAPVAFSGEISSGNKVTISVPQNVVTGGPVDIYIIANAESAGISLTETSTLAQIQGALIDDSKFSAANPTTEVPGTGLPMSRIIKGQSLVNGTTGEILTNLGTFDITRAVSKIIFAFGMYDGDFGEIIGISLDGSQIASSEYILPVEPSTANADDYANSYLGDLRSNIVADSYEEAELLFGAKTGTTAFIANTAIKKTTTNDNPANYTWTNWVATEAHSALSNQQKAEQYHTDITPFAKQTVYLRESDKKLTGKIYYRMSTDETATVKEAPFVMDAESEVQDFARNHIWIVYSYFEGGALYVNPTIADWIDADKLTYTLKMNTNMRLFDSWLYRYDTVDQDYSNWTNWAGSHMVVSEGRVTETSAVEPVAGRPLRSPQIQLVTTGVRDASVPGSGTFELTVDNSDFEIIRANKNEAGVVTSYEASTDGVLTIPAGDDVYTYFYVVPKVGVTPANPVAKVSLIYNDPVLGPVRVTYNYNSLPGYSDDSSEIWVYYVPADEYNIDGKLRMYFQDYNNPLVPTPVQS